MTALALLVATDRLLQHAQHYIVKHERPNLVVLAILSREGRSVRHNDVVECVDVCPPNLGSVVLGQTFDALEKNDPGLSELIGLSSDLPRYVVGNILKHADGNQVVIDVVASIAGVQMDCIEHCAEVFNA
jgi:hypothetical protein